MVKSSFPGDLILLKNLSAHIFSFQKFLFRNLVFVLAFKWWEWYSPRSYQLGVSDFCKVFASNFLQILFISLFISFGPPISLFSISSFLIIPWTAYVFSKFKKRFDDFSASLFHKILLLILTLFRTGAFGAAHGWGKASLKSTTHIQQWWKLFQLYLT